MKKRMALFAFACLAATMLAESTGYGFVLRPRRCVHGGEIPWQPAYADPAWGVPVAVLVPPTAGTQVHYSSTVSGTTRTGFPQFTPGYPGPQSNYNGYGVLPAPPQPFSTDQLGDYSVRGPR